MAKPLKTQALLTDIEWNSVELIFLGTLYLIAIKRLRTARNNPRQIRDLIDNSSYERAISSMNDRLRRKNSPFVLARMKSWRTGELQSDKLVALARRKNNAE